jgi:hypothetical protein
MRTLSPMTMVPVRSSMTTRDTWSGMRRSCSTSVMRRATSLP